MRLFSDDMTELSVHSSYIRIVNCMPFAPSIRGKVSDSYYIDYTFERQ